MNARALVGCSLFVLVTAANACSEATDPYAPDAGRSAVASTTDAEVEALDATRDAAKPTPKPGSAGQLVINEISGSGEWVELMNIGGKAIDVSGFKVADFDKATSGPKLKEALAFPNGTSVAPNEYVVVAGNAPSDGAPADCPSEGKAPCFSAPWGISNTNGDTIYLLGPDDAVLDEVAYPPNGAPSGSSWSRSPNGTGQFQPLPETPGADN